MTDKNSPKIDKPRRKRRWFRWLLVLMLVSLIAGELVARYLLGFGDPPLFVLDPKAEYYFAPSRTYHRFGSTIHMNQWSMRADDFPAHKSSPNELRIVVVGDSIINGGAPVDDAKLVTRLLQHDLAERLHRPVVVGNLSALSWGPANQLAMLNKIGWLDEDLMVFVWSSHDVGDVPTFDSVPYTLTTPKSAMWEAIREYGPRLWWKISVGRTLPEPQPEPSPIPVDSCMDAMRAQIKIAKDHGAQVLVVRHYEKRELNQPELLAHRAIREVAESEGAEVLSFDTAYRAAMQKGVPVYRDFIHPSAEGHRVMADALFDAIIPMVTSAKHSPTTKPASRSAP